MGNSLVRKLKKNTSAGEGAVDAELLDLMDDDPMLAAGAALAEADVARSPKEADRWRRTAERMEALAEVRRTMPFAAGGPAGVRVATATELHEQMAAPDVQTTLARENAALEAGRLVGVETRRVEVERARDRIGRLPVEFRRRLGLLARIDHRAVSGMTAGGIAVVGGGAGLVEAEIPICELAVDVARVCGQRDKVEAMAEALKGVPADMRYEIVEESVGSAACASWPVSDLRLFFKALRLAVAFLTDPASVVLLDNPGRLKHSIADRAADKGLAAMGTLPPALAESTDTTTPIDRRLAAVRATESPALLPVPNAVPE
jgi:hypothetical protein